MAADGGNPMGKGCSCGPEHRHIPVLLAEVLKTLQPADGCVYIDGTFGAGGYSRAMLDAADCRVIAFDRDPDAIRDGGCLVETYAPRLQLVQQPFGEMADSSAVKTAGMVDGIVLDIGVSSMQLDQPGRGFSFQSDGPLDMRMFGETEDRPSAADLVNGLPQETLADIIFYFGDERRARAIAAAIVKARAGGPIMRTVALAELCSRVYGRRPKDGIHPATRTFQALRIAVNDELGELVRGLTAAECILQPGGRLVVVTFHSLEDRIVKRFFAARSGRSGGTSRHLPAQAPKEPPGFQIVNQRPLLPSNQETAANPRARSAKLRAGVRTDADAIALNPTDLGLPPVVLA
ncbi:MAG: 16S rRNA (cytosine(1402)-N(4))-methyltransferase RsmH [Hyphomicrobiaceae bacterium]